jgi:hypothetical protein
MYLYFENRLFVRINNVETISQLIEIQLFIHI